MVNFNECHNCDHRNTCRQTEAACKATEDWTHTNTYALVKAAQATLASALKAGELQVGLCMSLLELKLALAPFKE